MHILVTNDDGPPSAASSPYILPFVSHLLAAGHRVSICIPSTQRSWIAKAHLVGKALVATPYTPPSYSFPADSPAPFTAPVTSLSPAAAPSSVADSLAHAAQWYLVDSTPASCAQLGLHHLFSDVDLVVSGPNYGRNTTAVFALSSGTLGGALEACVAGYKAIALSFAFFDRNNDPLIVAGACRHAVRVVEYLAQTSGWDDAKQVGPVAEGNGNEAGVVYSVNVPLVKDVEAAGTKWTRMLANRWHSSCFAETEAGAARDVAEHEIREGEVDGQSHAASVKGTRHFKWAPQFGDVYTSVERAGPGSDGWAVSKGQTSVTMLRANFEHVEVEGRTGDVKL